MTPKITISIDWGGNGNDANQTPNNTNTPATSLSPSAASSTTYTLKNPVCIRDFEIWASQNTPKPTWDYWSTGAVDHVTLGLNCSAFDDLRLLPRVMRDVSLISTQTRRKIFGKFSFASPIGISPTSEMKLAHQDGERGAARAAARWESVHVMSTMTTMGFEEVGGGAREVLREEVKGLKGVITRRERIVGKDEDDMVVPSCWFQLYLGSDWKDTERLVKDAEAGGYAAVVVTVDFPKWGRRLHALRDPFVMPPDIVHALAAAPSAVLPEEATTSNSLEKPPPVNLLETMTWDKDVQLLRRMTRLPIVLKGILHPGDAVRAMEIGVDGIVVSNHGARQLDTAPATIEALPHIVHALRTHASSQHQPLANIPHVFLDGGIRRGTDVLKALAFGAEMVFVGRPSLWSLRWGGESGVYKMLELLNEELRNAMALCGLRRLEEVDESCVWWGREMRTRPGTTGGAVGNKVSSLL